MAHRPRFTFRTHGGECAGQQWVYDGEEPIARFERRVIEQPEQELRYFDGNLRPVNLRDLKLSPGGRPLIAGVQLFWVFQHGVCNWGYDIHFGGHYARDELYGPICERFRILLCPDGKAKEMLEVARPVPEVEYKGFRELPVYERETSFEKGLRLNEPSRGDTDPWPWHPDGEGLSWDRAFGRSDNFSLKVQKETPGPSEWFYDREGDGAWTEPWRPTVGFRVTGYIRTGNVKGRGSCIAVRWGVYNYPERYPYICSEKLSGTNDWTRVSVEIQGRHPPDCSGIHIILRQDGSGTTWFDDLRVERLQ
ncbi:MAG: hypothetical protein A3F84_14445 [Candidatus Handelsmanbacteria bacterium RIFCSPLOWO2_12_FULL_64_10]|uniref:Uncharacterized protein n=1 Tax=Handelsmanbacteria sp. (strain RIFCSPLOWO2_12_FULL_64_10) TaxID=1817868 RepID=A0A1F6CPW4_HANXR|nr:MAG: hypothetical protein A3F84_14445 [Candidatus Handelsmanbacteria bacterium RIFCSPLOWO2_12_FULL_64_10]